MEVFCCYCGRKIDGACYVVYDSPRVIEYRHVYCYAKEVKQPLDYAEDDIPFGEVTDTDGWLD